MTESLTFRIVGDPTSGNKALDGISKKTNTVTTGMSSAFKKAGSFIGGEIGELATKLGDGLETLGEKGVGLGTKMTAAGVGIAGAGAALTMMGSKEKASQDQLKQAIADTGGAYSDYRDEIEKTVGRMQNLDHGTKDTEGALAVLTQATQDPNKALEKMGLVADLAASKHISLTEAAGLLAKILAGSGTRTLKTYGITTTNVDQAVDQLSKRIKGQGSAAVDNWGSKWDILKTKAADFIDNLGAKYGPTITAAGSVLTAAGAATQMWGNHVARAAAAAAAAEDESAAGSRVAALAHVESSAEVATAAEATSATVVASEAAAMDAEESGATSSEVAAAEHVNASTVIAVASSGAAAGVVASSEVEIGAYEAAAAAATESAAASSIAFGPVGLAIAGVAVVGGLAAKAMGLFGGSTHAAIQPTDDFTNAIMQDNNALGSNTRQLIVNKLEKDGAYDAALKLGISQKTLTDAVMGNAAALATVNRAMGDYAGGNHVFETALDGGTNAQKKQAYASAVLSDAIGQSTKTLQVNEAAAKNKTAANAGLATSEKQVTTAQQDQKTAIAASTAATTTQVTEVDALSAALDKLSNKNVDAEQEQLRFSDALGTATKDLKDNGRAVNDNTAKGRANKEWLLSQISALNSVANAQANAGASTGAVTARMASNETALRKAAAAAHLNAAEVNALIAKYHAVPGKVYTQVYAETETAAQKLQDLYALERRLGSVTINAKVASGSAGVQRNAQGTGYFDGGLTTLDEIGAREVVRLPRGSQVYSGTQARSMFGNGGGGPTIVVQLPGTLVGTNELRRQLIGVLEDYAGSGGQIRIAQAVR